MDRLAKLDKDELARRMRLEFEKTMTEVAAAVNGAPDGHLIDASEERCRDVLGEFRRIAYETAVQMRVEATQADPSFSPGRPRAARVGEPVGADLLRAGQDQPPALCPSESGCKSQSRRLKGAGMRWTGPNAEAMTGLESLHQSNAWSIYFQSRLKVLVYRLALSKTLVFSAKYANKMRRWRRFMFKNAEKPRF